MWASSSGASMVGMAEEGGSEWVTEVGVWGWETGAVTRGREAIIDSRSDAALLADNNVTPENVTMVIIIV